MVFTNATKVMINNKEVQSIKVTSNNGILYQTNFVYELDLATNKNILNANESATVTATLTSNGVGASNKKILFYNPAKPPVNNPGNGAFTENLSLGNAFKLKYIPYDTGTQIELKSNDVHLFYRANGDVSISFNESNRWTTIWNCKDYLKLKNGILSDSNGNTYDISNYDNNLILYRIYSKGFVYPDIFDEVATDANGQAIMQYNGVGAGNITIKGICLEKDVSDTITIQDLNRRLTLTSNKNTLSYANHDTATLTATLTANNNPIQGENIYIYNNPNNIEFDQMLYGPLYYPCIRLKLEGDGIMTFPGGRGLNINLYNSNNQYIDSVGLSTEKWSIVSSNGEILLKNETENYTVNFASFTQYFIIEIGINAQNQTDYPIITSSTFSTFIETITTDSNGEASRIYNSQGVGDVEFIACNPNMNLQATYNLKDYTN